MSATTARIEVLPPPAVAPLPLPTSISIHLTHARAATRRAATTFALACRLLPGDLRNDVYLLYLVFRTLDDLVDEGRPDAGERVAAAQAWADGSPSPRTREIEVLEALATRYPLPLAALADFCAGMGQDLRRERFATERELDHYCYRVAGTVGVVMTALLGSREPDDAYAAAASLGMAMQRTNILRDIDEDAANGRVYLAAETLARYGPAAPGRREVLLREQIARADALYEGGLAGIPLLCEGRAAIAAAAAMYREILREIERGGYGPAPGRAVVSRPRKLLVGLCAAARP